MAVHLVAAPADPDRPGHGLAEADAWTTVATVTPVHVAPRPTAAGVAAASGLTPVRSGSAA